MSHTRALILASVVAASTLLVSVTPAIGGTMPPSLDAEAVCNTATGDYDVTYTLTIPGTQLPAEITVASFLVDGEPGANPTFEPNPAPPDVPSVASASVPGDTTSLYLDVDIAVQGVTLGAEAELDLDGDCEPPTTTTTVETTSTPAPAAQAVARQPAFTG